MCSCHEIVILHHKSPDASPGDCGFRRPPILVRHSIVISNGLSGSRARRHHKLVLIFRAENGPQGLRGGAHAA